ncbi:kinase-like domain-containing protein [Aspergillus transmontanensis]|uniref:Kinase-like domain-containing protein n=1 Tax=Aspergillus transmontanensis TaxID=1034304 RepID=A0A5N6W639_9EURO|nr:kinase-like domain-containing protein [Aspergillus transmontanensis]
MDKHGSLPPISFIMAESNSTPSANDSSTTPNGCIALTFERGYYRHDNFFIKRSLRPSEFRTGYKGLHIPRLGKERLENEVEVLQFIRRVRNIPVPQLYGAFEIDGSYLLIMEYVEGISMSHLSESTTIGGPSGIVIPPYRVMRQSNNDSWIRLSSATCDYVFCHYDLSQQNVIVDPETLKIKAIIDWEYAGLFPANFDYPFYKRLGPSMALEGERDDVLELLQFLNSESTN